METFHFNLDYVKVRSIFQVFETWEWTLYVNAAVWNRYFKLEIYVLGWRSFFHLFRWTYSLFLTWVCVTYALHQKNQTLQSKSRIKTQFLVKQLSIATQSFCLYFDETFRMFLRCSVQHLSGIFKWLILRFSRL